MIEKIVDFLEISNIIVIRNEWDKNVTNKTNY